MNREVDRISEDQIRNRQSRELMLAALERASQFFAGGKRQALSDEGTIPTSEALGFAPDADIPIDAGGTDLRPDQADNRTGRGAWGGHANGRIPLDELIQVGSGHRMERQAAVDFERMKRAAAQDGVSIRLSSSYRDYDGQVSIRKSKGDRVATATPGTSIHGWGKAIDVSGEKAQAWMRANAARYGWFWPEWAQRTGTKSFEPWHWEWGG